jgi:predicted RND superfamily exporter protein
MAERLSEKAARFFIHYRGWVVFTIGFLTLCLLYPALKEPVHTVFSDLLPARHPYVQTNEQYKHLFGGQNVVNIMVSARQGDIFQKPVLEQIHNITQELQKVDAINPFQVYSLASPNLKVVHASTYGIESRPLMWPDLPKTKEEIERLRKDVLSNPLVYGVYVSLDQKAARIRVDFYDHLLNTRKAYQEIMAIVQDANRHGVRAQVVGEPILQGIVRDYLPQTLAIFVLTIMVLGLLLFFIYVRTLRGTLIPLLSAVITAILALGICDLVGWNFDPLAIVIVFLISCRDISHSVQSITRYEALIQEGVDSSIAAARASLSELWTPGLLSVVADAGAILVVALAPIPLLQKAAYIGAVWVFCIAPTGVILTPVLLSWVSTPQPRSYHLDLRPWLMRQLRWCANVATGKGRFWVLGTALAILLVCGIVATRITIGDAEPGSPLLWPTSPYNRAVADINSHFPGTDRMFVVVEGKEKGALTHPDVLRNMEGMQRFIDLQPQIGGSISLANVIPAVNQVINEGNPRYCTFGHTAEANGELLYVATTKPGDLSRFTDDSYRNGAVTFFFRDHRGRTIRTAIARINSYIAAHPMADARYRLAGGLIGIMAAVNEVIFAGQVESIALALLVVLLCASLTYRSGFAGIFFMIPILLSNTVTFAYMVVKGIGLSVSALPVAALGIGLGVDYSIYVVDSIKENYALTLDLKSSIHAALGKAGLGVIVTAEPLILCTALWYIFSSLKFQANMAILIAIWMGVSVISALLVMPALTFVLKPRFILGQHSQSDALWFESDVGSRPRLGSKTEKCTNPMGRDSGFVSLWDLACYQTGTVKQGAAFSFRTDSRS